MDPDLKARHVLINCTKPLGVEPSIAQSLLMCLVQSYAEFVRVTRYDRIERSQCIHNLTRLRSPNPIDDERIRVSMACCFVAQELVVGNTIKIAGMTLTPDRTTSILWIRVSVSERVESPDLVSDLNSLAAT